MNNNAEKIRHSLSHLMAMVILEKFPKTKLGIGPTIEKGFYYDFEFPKGKTLSDTDLLEIEKQVKDLIKQDLLFKKEIITPANAKKIFKDQPYKLELIAELQKAKKPITIYTTQTKSDSTRTNAEGQRKSASSPLKSAFVDLCAGPHIKSTKEINPDAFKLNKLAGAYWRGDEKNKMLTRVYGWAFETKDELKNHLNFLEEAEKRDHRKLGKELDLFLIDPMVGMGLAMWQPKGALLWRIMEEFWYQEHLKNGYDLVRTPHIGNRKLWETSGHWGFYNESMYPPIEVGQSLKEKQEGKKASVKEEYLLKPMNCPFHVTIYNSKPRSYKEMPFRWAECGTVYRYEKSGELSGLTRVRGFTQDDAHIICRKDQVKAELKRVADFILFILKTFGFKDFSVYLSLRDPKNKKKYAGNDAGWLFTQKVLEEVAKEQGLDYKKEIGEAAFYGPKLDYKIKDSIGREWQCSTLQFDFNLPERFDMNYINEKGQKERPFVLHRALFGSFERFIGVLIEHYAGAFPVWLSPIQVTILPVSEKHFDYAEKIKETLIENNIRVELKDVSETLGKRIREAKMQKTPYVLVVGDQEKINHSVNITSYNKGQEGEITLNKFIERIKEEIQKKS